MTLDKASWGNRKDAKITDILTYRVSTVNKHHTHNLREE